MGRSICIIAGCGNVVNGRGFCDKHYHRFMKYGHPEGGPQNHDTPEGRFLRKIKKTKTCWTWIGAIRPNGYGQMQIGGKGSKTVSAHRYSYEFHKGSIPSGLIVMHTCDNPACVNPDHLVLGTHKQNTADMIQKGRKRTVAPVGTENGKAVLDPDKVRFIRANPDMSHAALARELNVGDNTVRGVRTGRCWSHIK